MLFKPYFKFGLKLFLNMKVKWKVPVFETNFQRLFEELHCLIVTVCLKSKTKGGACKTMMSWHQFIDITALKSVDSHLNYCLYCKTKTIRVIGGYFMCPLAVGSAFK